MNTATKQQKIDNQAGASTPQTLGDLLRELNSRLEKLERADALRKMENLEAEAVEARKAHRAIYG